MSVQATSSAVVAPVLLHGLAKNWWLFLIRGIAAIVFGVLSFAWPGLTALILLIFIACWSVASGVFQIIGAIQLRKVIDNEWLLILSGALSIAFGVVLFLMPGAGALALIWLIASYAIVFGILTVAFAFRLRRHQHHGA